MSLDQAFNQFHTELQESITSLKTKASALPDVEESLELQSTLNKCSELLDDGRAFEVNDILHLVFQRIDHLLSLNNQP